jgi:hypothetical protein
MSVYESTLSNRAGLWRWLKYSVSARLRRSQQTRLIQTCIKCVRDLSFVLEVISDRMIDWRSPGIGIPWIEHFNCKNMLKF